MVNKRVLSLFLAFSLLTVPVTTSRAYSLQGFQDWAYSLINIDREAAEKLMTPALLFAGILAMSGLWYWMQKKAADGGKKDEPMIPTTTVVKSQVIEPSAVPVPAVETNPVAPTLEQLSVYSQFNYDGGGGASCGYQTLLRSMQVVKGLSENEPITEIKKTLMQSAAIQTYFGTANSSWRKEIIEKRKADELKKLLHPKFVSALRIDPNSKESELYQSALGKFEDEIVVSARNPAKSSLGFNFEDDDIREYIRDYVMQMENEDTEDATKNLINKLKQPEVIDQSFNYQTMRDQVLSKKFILSLPTLVQKIDSDPDLKSDFNGEWLSDGEVELLWGWEKNQKNSIIPSRVECGFKAIANFDLVGNPDIDIEFDEVASYIKDDIKPLLNQKKQLFQVFALGTMRQGSDTVGTRGHWYPLVMHQNKEGNRKYYIMDSADNANRKNDLNVWKIIKLIEGK